MKKIVASQIVKELTEDIPASVGRHDRFSGTPADEQTTNYIMGKFEHLGLAPERHVIEFMGWLPCAEPEFSIIRPKTMEIRASHMSWSGNTGQDGVEGELKYIGKTSIISGLFYWDKYTIITADGLEKGHVIGISDQEYRYALPEPLERADYNFPSVIIGYNDNELLKQIMEEHSVQVRLKTSTKFLPQSKTYNITADIKGEKFPDKYIVVSCHHDTLPDDPGASDNASGVACMLKLAEMFIAEPAAYSVRFLSCAAEEWNDLGVRYYVRDLKERGFLDSIIADLEIDTVGHPEGEKMYFYCLNDDSVQIRKRLYKVLNESGFKEEKDFIWHEPSGGLDSWQFHVNGIPTLTIVWWPFPTMHQHYASGFPADIGINSKSMDTTVEIFGKLIKSF